MINNNFDIPFNQNQFSQFLREQKNSPFKSKLINISNQYNVFGGYCFGLSNIYLKYKLKNKDDKFIDAFKNIRHDVLDKNHFKRKLITNEIINKDKRTIINSAIKKSDFENLSTQVINSQTFNMKYAFIIKLKETIYSITRNNNSHGKIKFKDHLNTLMEELIHLTKNDQSFSLEERKSNINFVHDIHITACELYRHALPPKKREAFFQFLSRKKTNNLEIKDNDFNRAVQEIKDTCKIRDGEFTNQDIGKILAKACMYYNNSNYKNWLVLNDSCLDKNNSSINHQNKTNNLFYYRTNLSDFINKLTPNKDHYYFFISQNHACAVTMKKLKNGKYEYSFFDPNKGIKYFYNIISFKNFMYNFVRENENYYKFIRNEKDNDYSIMFINLETP